MLTGLSSYSLSSCFVIARPFFSGCSARLFACPGEASEGYGGGSAFGPRASGQRGSCERAVRRSVTTLPASALKLAVPPRVGLFRPSSPDREGGRALWGLHRLDVRGPLVR